MSQENEETTEERFFDTKKRIIFALVLLVIVAVGLGVLNQVLKTTKNTTALFANVTKLDVKVGNGTLALANATGANVVVERKVTYLLRGPSLSQKVEGDTLVIRQNCSGLHIGQCDTAYSILVPPSVATVIASDGGKVDLNGTQGLINVVTSGGEINANKTFGDLDFITDNGNVKGSDLSSLRTKATTKGGKIELTLAVAPTNVDVRSTDGNVSVQVPDENTAYKVDAGSTNNKSSIELNNETNSPRLITARSDNGKVKLTSK